MSLILVTWVPACGGLASQDHHDRGESAEDPPDSSGGAQSEVRSDGAVPPQPIMEVPAGGAGGAAGALGALAVPAKAGAGGQPPAEEPACVGICEDLGGERVCHVRSCDLIDDECGRGAVCVEFGRLWSPANCGPVPCLPIYQTEATCVPEGLEACDGDGKCADGSSCAPLEICACEDDGTRQCFTSDWKRVCPTPL